MLHRRRLYLAGPAGAGKSTVAELLRVRFAFHRASLGGIVRQECAARGIPPTRAHLQQMGDLMRGGDSAALAIRAHLAVPDAVDNVVVDGVRLRTEAAYLRRHGYVGISVEAPARIRQERLRTRDGSPFVPVHATEVQAEYVPVDFALSTDTTDFDELDLRVISLLSALAIRGWAVGSPLFRVGEHMDGRGGRPARGNRMRWLTRPSSRPWAPASGLRA